MFFIGIDANRHPLQKISEKIHRRPSKGGLPNVLFMESAVESLPAELEGLASEVYANFPWGSLLSAVAGVDAARLSNLNRICSPGGLLRVVFGIDEVRDRTEIERLQLPSLTLDNLSTILSSYYESAGFEILEYETRRLVEVKLETSWARRLRGNPNRSLIRLLARVRRQ